MKCKTIQGLGTNNYSIPFKEEGEKQRWIKINELQEETLTFKTDQIAFNKLKKFLSF